MSSQELKLSIDSFLLSETDETFIKNSSNKGYVITTI